MKKVLSLLLCLLLCLPLIVGCTDNGSTTESGTETGTETTADTSGDSESASTADAPLLTGIKIGGNDIAGYFIVKPADASESEAFAAEEHRKILRLKAGNRDGNSFGKDNLTDSRHKRGAWRGGLLH